ncbi:reverse transcriptase domain-containing protein [Tanacetum coccineum]
MQSLIGKLAALNRFLSRSAEKSLPFFKTLKEITKENKHDYCWTEGRKCFPRTQKMILDLPALTNPLLKETLFIYLAASKEAVSAVLLVVRKGKQYSVHYVSRTLHDTERNYAPLEKMALALRHVSRRLRSAIKGHILADFINEVPVGGETMVPRKTQYIIDRQKDCKEEWVLYTDGASSIKGSDAGLVFTNPT